MRNPTRLEYLLGALGRALEADAEITYEAGLEELPPSGDPPARNTRDSGFRTLTFRWREEPSGA